VVDAPILLFGSTGQLGRELRQKLAGFADVVVPERKTVDFLNSESLKTVVRETAPSLIINAAAYTAVDMAEEDEGRAIAVNATAPGILAAEAEHQDIPLIHFSTDFVFDGRADRPYLETDEVNPLNVYGRTKRAGEDAIRESGAAHLIFRTSWIYARYGKNFLRTMERLFQERDEIAVVADQIGTPTWANSLAEATASIVRLGVDTPELYIENLGTYHMTGAGQTSWHGLASAYFFARESRGITYRCKAVKPISTDCYPTPARRPAYSVLDSTKLERTFDIVLPDWETQLTHFLEEPPPQE
jgi:dTDP-4-dehydrorhamnose reductase